MPATLAFATRPDLDDRLSGLREAYGELGGPELVHAFLTGPFAGRTACVSSFGAESAVLLDMVAAVDRATVANGCLQLLRGSHHLGRFDHGTFGTQTGADPARVEAARARCELVHFTAEPGDAVFFHSNTLHGSAPNTSEYPRWSLIMCYNARSNTPFAPSSHPNYTPLSIVDDAAIMAWSASAAAV